MKAPKRAKRDSSEVAWKKIVGAPVRKAALERAGILTAEDFFNFLPRDYEDWRDPLPLKDLPTGVPVTFIGEVQDIKPVFAGRMKFTRATITDETGSLAVYWFNTLLPLKTITVGARYAWHGIVRPPKDASKKNALPSVAHPAFELADKPDGRLGKLVPIYARIPRYPAAQWRAHWEALAPSCDQPVPWPKGIEKITRAAGIPAYETTAAWYRRFHFPKDEKDIAEAMRLVTLAEMTARAGLVSQNPVSATPLKVTDAAWKKMKASLPFVLTPDQDRAADETREDLAKARPMRRLLQGDVGSGKTAVAALAAAIACANGKNAALLAPTSLLAKQHYETIQALWEKGQWGGITLVTGGGIGKDTGTGVLHRVHRSEAKEEYAPTSGRGILYIGTTALLFAKNPPELSIAIVDEQHRFGVKQREAISRSAHLLSLTATPIPRTVALLALGQLAYGCLATKPGNRKPVTTKIIRSAADEEKTWAFCRGHVAAGNKIFIVCPKIEPAEEGAESDIQSAESFHAAAKKIFAGHSVALLHGGMKKDEQEKIMNRFKESGDVLVATTVIEVGIDVPEATVMVVMAAERFGLATLHQLRGRVGRNDKQCFCFLRPSAFGIENARLAAMEKTNDGQELAELDFQTRGGGDRFGTAQSGIVTEFTFPDALNPALLAAAEPFAAAVLKLPAAQRDWWLARASRAVTGHLE